MRLRKALSMVGVAVIALLALGTASPATAAGLLTTTTFLTPATQEVGFGAPWFIKIQVRQVEYFGPLDSADGTVDVFAEGISEPLGDDLPITRDGIAYFAQPADQPLLAAGSYVFSATFTPASGTETVTSRTTKPTTLVITPLAVTSTFEVIDDPSRYAQPTVEARLAGDYVDATGRAPSGSWAIAVTDDAGAEVFTDTAAQAADASAPTVVPLTSGIKPGKDYSVSATFTPDPAIAGGLEVGATEPKKLATAPSGALDGAVAPVSLPWWLIITLLGIVALLAATVIVLLAVGSRRGPAVAPAAPALEPAFEPAAAFAGGAAAAQEAPIQGIDFFDGAHDADQSPTTVLPAAHEPPAFGDLAVPGGNAPATAESDGPASDPDEFPSVEERRSWSLGDDRD